MKQVKFQGFVQFRQFKYLETAGQLTILLNSKPEHSELLPLCWHLHAEYPGFRTITFITADGAYTYEAYEIPSAFYFFYERVLKGLEAPLI